MTWHGSLWSVMVVVLPSLCLFLSGEACRDSRAASYLRAASKPSKVGFSFFAGVWVRVNLEEPFRRVGLPKGPFSSGCRFCWRALGWSLGGHQKCEPEQRF